MGCNVWDGRKAHSTVGQRDVFCNALLQSIKRIWHKTKKKKRKIAFEKESKNPTNDLPWKSVSRPSDIGLGGQYHQELTRLDPGECGSKRTASSPD
jgi:hypothetical protein